MTSSSGQILSLMHDERGHVPSTGREKEISATCARVVDRATLPAMSDLDRIVDAWDQTMRACVALGEPLTAEEWGRPTECPEWTVKDIYAHLVGGEVWMAEGHPPPAQGLARIADEPVRERREHSGPRVLAELRDVLTKRTQQIRDTPPDPDAPTMTAYLQPVTVGILYRMRAFDAWVHEQDIRRALDRPGNLDTPAAEISRSIFVAALPRVVAKLAGAPPGARVRLSVTGPVAFDQTITVDEHRRAHLADLAAAEPSEAPTVALHTDWETFSRLAAGRIPPPTAPVEITGDAALGARILANLAVTP
jgi:uncharacterized protein (TIGR03083 family)